MKRPMRTVALEPQFSIRSTRAFVCGGMVGDLVLHEKGWLGHRETILDRGEGPIYQVRWHGRLIAWVNDLGVKIYDTQTQTRLIFIDRPPESPRADLFKCTLRWENDSTLLIAWADLIKVVRIRERPPKLAVEITAVLQLDCMIAGIVPYLSTDNTNALLILTYNPPEALRDETNTARVPAERPELRILSRAGNEISSDLISLANFQDWSCNDYGLVQVPGQKQWVVLSPKDLVLVRSRDKKDHVSWLLERGRFEEALTEVEAMEASGEAVDEGSAAEIGQKYLEHLLSKGDYARAAKLCPKVCAHDPKKWEDWIFVFVEKHQLQAVIPYVPTDSPRLDHVVYEVILAHFLTHDREVRPAFPLKCI